MDNKQIAAALHCSVALGCIDSLLQLEVPKSARWNRLCGAIEQINRCVDLYRLERFSVEDMNNASAILDTVNERIKEFYP